jgi:hypothetical protein
MMPSMPIPIAPPIRAPSSHTSMLCAQPSACSSARVRRSVSVSQRGSRPVRHSSATRPNAVSAVVRMSSRRSCFLTFRPRWAPPARITGLGSGDHHATWYGSPCLLPTRAIVPSATRSSYRNSLMVRRCSSAAGGVAGWRASSRAPVTTSLPPPTGSCSSARSERIAAGRASAHIRARRSGGSDGSSGRYPQPAFMIESRLRIASAPRPRWTPITVAGAGKRHFGSDRAHGAPG